MAEQSTPSKAQLIETLRSTGAETAARLRSLPPEAFEQGRYENGWNGRQILAHIASIEWTYPRLFDLARQASPPRAPRPPRHPARQRHRRRLAAGRPSPEGGQHGYPGHLPKEARHSDRPR